MNTGKTLFAQLMGFLLLTTSTLIFDQYFGKYRVRTLVSAKHFRFLAFTQLTEDPFKQ